MTTIEYNTTLEVLDCSECAAPIALTSVYRAARQNDHKTFWCPNGHRQHYPGKSVAERLRTQLDEKERELREVQHQRDIEQTRVAAAETELKKATTRRAAGVCPCCTRTFKQLAAHMKNKHPEVS